MSDASIDKQRVADSFSRAAATYDQAAAFQRSAGSNLLAQLPPQLEPLDIVDLGAGTGYFTRALAHRFAAPVAGLDLAEGMLRFARQCNGPEHELLSRHPRWVVADAEALPLRPASQDLIFSSLALQWCPDLARAVAEARQALRPGGCLAFNTLVEGTLFELQRAWQAVDGFVHVNRFMPTDELHQILNASGFTHWRCEVETHVLRYAQLSELTRELKALGAHNINQGRPGGLTGRARLRALTQAYETFRQTEGLPATYQVAQILMFKES
ncbi:malonyl-ACP O-methyltransferase BioC [uncultured Halopseudomonas sp.]|uniref:malonyl-ACP O-methyltransferase BioC n=1 Tax=uncultured Halopseudomonas sp. TaxID=2901193 RepID=UPI0030EEA4AE|tara:strand:- start:35494 stop:36303 length:810 start_codon:yes stop_codon:yes gene_type:complete